MKVIYVDDERSAHINFRYIIENRNDIHTIKYFFDYESAINYASENKVDCAFLDIRIGDKNGIDLAKELCSLQPEIELVFVTGYDEFTKEAYKLGARAYISKPYVDEDINNALDIMRKLVKPQKEMVNEFYDDSVHIFAKTFGSFDLIVDDVPVHFKNSKAKELMAFLVHQMGGTVTNTQIFYALWENQEYTRSTSTYVRRTIRALKSELELYNIDDIISSGRNSLSIDIRKITCDAYEMIKGNVSAINKYNSEYMRQYSWGEDQIALLDRIANKSYE